MKKARLFFRKIVQTILLTGVLVTSISVANAQTKRGLIVAIGDYPTDTKWRTINSANDIPLVRSALVKQGFQSSDIAIVQDKDATKEAIVNSIEALIKSSKKGDIVVIHFSAHGQQIEDDNGDELDGYDEAIVAYGAPAYYEEDYDFSQHLRDDELEVLLERLRHKIGPNGDVIVFADACHSGTVSRGELSRGGIPAYQRPDYIPGTGKADVGLYQQKSVRYNAEDLAPIVVISASQASEVNYEYEGAGSLSTAISRSVDKLNKNMSYRSFFSQILKEMSIMAPTQKPAIEGDIDRTLFAGQIIEQEPFYKAYNIRDNFVYLYGGQLNGLFDGTVVLVYPMGTTSIKNGKPIATGEVITAEGTWSKLKLDKELDGELEDYWFFVTERTYGNIVMNIEIDIRNRAIKDQLTSIMDSLPLFNVTKDDLDFILEDGGRGRIDIIRASDRKIFAEQLSGANNYEAVIEALKDFARGSYFKNLELTDSRFNVVFEFIPVRVDEDNVVTDTLTVEEISENGVMVFTHDISTLIKVTNLGDHDAYFSIIDIQPDGKINGILPSDNKDAYRPPDFYHIKAGHSYIVQESTVTFSDPYGFEVFKLFASLEPIDFTPIITQKPRTRSEMTDLETLFDDTYADATRGGTTRKIRSTGMEASTSYISFEIRE